MIRFQCNACGAELQVPESRAGQSGSCPQCAQGVVIPAPAAAAPAAPAAPPPIPGETAPPKRESISLGDIVAAPFRGDLAAEAVTQAMWWILLSIPIGVCWGLAIVFGHFLALVGLALGLLGLAILLWVLGRFIERWVAVVEQYEGGGLMASTQRTKRQCAGIWALSLLIASAQALPVSAVGCALWRNPSPPVARVGLALILAGMLWFVVYYPMGFAMAIVDRTYHPGKVIRRIGQTLGTYVPVVLLMGLFIVVSRLLAVLVQFLFASGWMIVVRELLCVTIVQYGVIAGLGMLGMLLRRHKLSPAGAKPAVAVLWGGLAIALIAALAAVLPLPQPMTPATPAQRAERRIAELIDQMSQPARGKQTDPDRPKPEDVAAEIAQLLPERPHFFRDVLAGLSDAPGSQANRKEIALTHIMDKLPQETDLAGLLEIPPQNKRVRRTARDLLIRRAKTDWLLEKSCSADAAVRSFAADVLQATFPMGPLSEADALQLAKAVGVEEKRRSYRQFLSAQEALLAGLVGSYRLQLRVTVKTNSGSEDPRVCQSEKTHLQITRSEGIWSLRTEQEQWTGPTSRLDEARLKLRVPFSDLVAGERGTLYMSVRCQGGRLAVVLERDTVNRNPRTSRPGYTPSDPTLLKK